MRGTSDIGLIYDRGSDTSGSVVGYIDSDYAGDLDRKRSLTGYIFILCDGAISWKTTLQSIVALFTIEAEYMSATEAIKETIWLRGLIGDLGFQ